MGVAMGAVGMVGVVVGSAAACMNHKGSSCFHFQIKINSGGLVKGKLRWRWAFALPDRKQYCNKARPVASRWVARGGRGGGGGGG